MYCGFIKFNVIGIVVIALYTGADLGVGLLGLLPLPPPPKKKKKKNHSEQPYPTAYKT